MHNLQLPYNPDNFARDLAYLETEQEKYILSFISKRYSRNKDFIELVKENTTKTFIKKASSLYSRKVKYPEWEDEYWIYRRKTELSKLEQYYNLNKIANSVV